MRFFQGVKGDPNLVKLFAIAGPADHSCTSADPGIRYQQAAGALGGTFESICAVRNGDYFCYLRGDGESRVFTAGAATPFLKRSEHDPTLEAWVLFNLLITEVERPEPFAFLTAEDEQRISDLIKKICGPKAIDGTCARHSDMRNL